MTGTTLEILIGCIPPVLWNLVFFATKVKKRMKFSLVIRLTGTPISQEIMMHSLQLFIRGICAEFQLASILFIVRTEILYTHCNFITLTLFPNMEILH